jgi:hypothetical protein
MTNVAPIEFAVSASDVRVTSDVLRLTVEEELGHDPSGGNKQWFQPLSAVEKADVGQTIENAFADTSLGTRWSDPYKRSGFFGTFAR